MIHVSTAYSNCHLRRIEERFYDYPVKFEDLEEKIDHMDEKTIDNMTSKWVCDEGVEKCGGDLPGNRQISDNYTALHHNGQREMHLVCI